MHWMPLRMLPNEIQIWVLPCSFYLVCATTWRDLQADAPPSFAKSCCRTALGREMHQLGPDAVKWCQGHHLLYWWTLSRGTSAWIFRGCQTYSVWRQPKHGHVHTILYSVFSRNINWGYSWVSWHFSEIPWLGWQLRCLWHHLPKHSQFQAAAAHREIEKLGSQRDSLWSDSMFLKKIRQVYPCNAFFFLH